MFFLLSDRPYSNFFHASTVVIIEAEELMLDSRVPYLVSVRIIPSLPPDAQWLAYFLHSLSNGKMFYGSTCSMSSTVDIIIDQLLSKSN